MRALPGAFVEGALPQLDPLIAYEATDCGWRGLTQHGEVLHVNSGAAPPTAETEFVVYRCGIPIGRRAVQGGGIVDITAYLKHFNRAIALFKADQLDDALTEVNAAIGIASTARARFNRSLMLLHLGRWLEAWPDYESRLDLYTPHLVARAKQMGIPQWQGEDIRGKRLLLVHDAGYGDTLQNLRFIPRLRARGAEVLLAMPPELAGLRIAPSWEDNIVDYFVPMLSLLTALQVTPQNIPCARCLDVDEARAARWRWRIGPAGTRRKIGIAWSVGKVFDGDYPRSIPLTDLVSELKAPDVDLYSLQKQECEEAERLGVKTFDYETFADVAAIASLMSEVVTVDTAAAHVAGAIGHTNVTLLLSHWYSWRWMHGNPFDPGFRLIRQAAPGDWRSVLSQLKG